VLPPMLPGVLMGADGVPHLGWRWSMRRSSGGLEY